MDPTIFSKRKLTASRDRAHESHRCRYGLSKKLSYEAVWEVRSVLGVISSRFHVENTGRIADLDVVHPP